MALPKLNDSPKYELIIPSTEQKVKFRPYLVKEEKVLMMAIESQDPKATLNAVVDTIVACVDENIKKKDLAIFDVEYMFTQIRSKSVGENTALTVKCQHCEEENSVNVNVSTIEVKVPKVDNMIQITDEITVEMEWPPYSDIIDIDGIDNVAAIGFELVGKCITAIVTEEERTLAKDVPTKELTDFIESMTSTQFSLLSKYVEQMPSLKHDIEFACTSCGKDNKITLSGMTDFF